MHTFNAAHCEGPKLCIGWRKATKNRHNIGTCNAAADIDGVSACATLLAERRIYHTAVALLDVL
jgi:hypothetical protein